MRKIGLIADTLLERVAPRITAAAVPCHGCSLSYCYCSGGFWYGQYCCLNLDCNITCGRCLKTSTTC